MVVVVCPPQPHGGKRSFLGLVLAARQDRRLPPRCLEKHGAVHRACTGRDVCFYDDHVIKAHF